jgi:hypothetical protein
MQMLPSGIPPMTDAANDATLWLRPLEDKGIEPIHKSTHGLDIRSRHTASPLCRRLASRAEAIGARGGFSAWQICRCPRAATVQDVTAMLSKDSASK